MRFDLIPERDRFIPGWHGRPDTRHPAFAPPEWEWPSRLYRAVRAFLDRLLQASRAADGSSSVQASGSRIPKAGPETAANLGAIVSSPSPHPGPVLTAETGSFAEAETAAR
jgi:hypothetical protein